MDPKTWRWRKKASDKTIFATEKANICVRRIDEEVQMLPSEEEVRRNRVVKNLNEKLASVLVDRHGKDDLVANHAKVSEAIAGTGKAEAEAICLRKELDEALRQGTAANEKLTNSDAALKECREQLEFVQEEQDRRIHEAVMRASSEFEKARKAFEEKLVETKKRVESLVAENSHLSKALLVKEKLVEDLHKRMVQREAEFNTLMVRLDTTEKENAFLKYEFHVLEKELEIRNEEMEYTRRSADLAHKQHLESIKKITKLEGECQRLQLLVRKRLPGPAARPKTKSEAEMFGRDRTEMRGKKMNPTRDLIVRESIMENTPQLGNKKLDLLIEQLCDVQEENKILKDMMVKKNAELHSSRLMCSQTDSRLSQVEAHLKRLSVSKGQKSMELARYSPMSNEVSVTSSFDIGSDDGVSSSGSWATALISELEHFRDEKLRNTRGRKVSEVSDISLMDDFVEMEKLAIVSAEMPSRGACHPSSTNAELVQVMQAHSSFHDVKQIHSKAEATGKSFDWLQVVLSAILEQQRISKRGLNELLEDIRIALGCINHPNARQRDTLAISRHPGESDPLHISGYITWGSPSACPVINGTSQDDTLLEKASNQCVQSDLSHSMCKIIKLIKGVNITENSSGKDQCSLQLAGLSDYFIHVFQWKRSELNAVLQQFIHACNDLLNGKAEIGKFAEELSSALDWVLNNYITPKVASSTRDKIKQHFGWNEAHTEDEVRAAANCLLVESEKDETPTKQSSLVKSVTSSYDQNFSFQMNSGRCNLEEENKKLKVEMKNMEARLKSVADKNEELIIKLQESEEKIKNLQMELKAVKESKDMIEDQIENQKSINEDLDTQLTVAKARLNEVFQKFSSLEVELEYKNHCCEELEGTCLELQLQLESVAKNEPPKYGTNQEGKQPQNGWEIKAASVKLAECQETILNLGKQLKALASPRDAALFDKVFPNSGAASTAGTNKKLNKRSSLRDQMLAEDSAKAEVPNPNKTSEDSQETSFLPSNNNAMVVYSPETYPTSKNPAKDAAPATLAIVPSKKQRVGFIWKLLHRRKKGSSKRSGSLAIV